MCLFLQFESALSSVTYRCSGTRPGFILKAIGVCHEDTAGDEVRLLGSPALAPGMGASAMVAAGSSAASVPPLTASAAEARQLGEEAAVLQLPASQAQAAIAAMLSGDGGRRVPPGTLRNYPKYVPVDVTIVYLTVVC